MKRKQIIKHRIEQKTASRKHKRRRLICSAKGSTKSRSRHMSIPSMPTGPMPTTGRIGAFVNALKGKK